MACWSYSLAYGVGSDKYKMNNDKQQGEFQNIDEVRAAIDAQLKPFFDDMTIAIARVQKEIEEINRQEALDKKSAI